MTKRRKKNKSNGPNVPTGDPNNPPNGTPENPVIDPKKRIKVTKDEAERMALYFQGIMGLEAKIGMEVCKALDHISYLYKMRKMERNKLELHKQELVKKYKIIGEIIGVDMNTNEVTLK
jgi:hypothetical protein